MYVKIHLLQLQLLLQLLLLQLLLLLHSTDPVLLLSLLQSPQPR